jgi:hypothetical protein
MIEEATLFIAQILILLFRTKTVFDTGALCDAEKHPDYQPPAISTPVCNLVATILHLLYFIHFATFMLEAVHNYIVYTCVLTQRPIFKRKLLLLILFVSPFIIVLPTAVFSFTHYTNENTCWLNYNGINAAIEILPICIMSAVGIIISEATGMNLNLYKVNQYANEDLRAAAITSATSNVGIILVAVGEQTFKIQIFNCKCYLGAWLTGSLAVHLINLLFYTVATVLNILLAVLILLFHTVGNEKARAMVMKVCACLKKKNKNAVLESPKLDVKDGNENKKAETSDANAIKPDVLADEPIPNNDNGWLETQQYLDDMIAL